MHSSASRGQEKYNRVAVTIAQAVHRLRTERSWTLNELATRSGISRRLIVQIEQAQANPSIGTLLRLADAFEVTLSEVLPEQPAATVRVRPASEALQLWDGPRGGSCVLLVSHGPIELWSWTLKPGEVYESKPHRPGSVELLSVTAGILDVDVGRETICLSAGDSAWFDAATTHAYRNPKRSTTRFIMVFSTPDEPARPAAQR
jgi:DNA-binding XRE family transcriptional regulator/quercetin dioxygenase-like cupin family protein